jgi:hypothetical protein
MKRKTSITQAQRDIILTAIAGFYITGDRAVSPKEKRTAERLFIKIVNDPNIFRCICVCHDVKGSACLCPC